MNMKHTPLPWYHSSIDDCHFVNADFGTLPTICTMKNSSKDGNAEFIVRACNAYEKDQAVIAELAAALLEAINALDESAMSGLPNLRGATAEMRAVLAKAVE